LLDTGLRHSVLLVLEPTAALPVSSVAAAPRWFAPPRLHLSSIRTGLAVVATSRLERMAMSATTVLKQGFPVRVFAPGELQEAARWLRSTLRSEVPGLRPA
jgi:hypothetical protein